MMIPAAASPSTMVWPRQRRSASWRLMLRPAPWQEELKERDSAGPVVSGQPLCEGLPHEMGDDLAVRQGAVDRRPHRSQVGLADGRLDRRAGQLAVRQLDAVTGGRDAPL